MSLQISQNIYSKDNLLLGIAIENVCRLEEIDLSHFEPANIEAASQSITYLSDFDRSFVDKEAFVTRDRYLEETELYHVINALLEEGERLAYMMYTWRCLSRAVPTAQANDSDRTEMYRSTLDVMRPHIQQLRDLMRFHEKAIEIFCTQVETLCHAERKYDFVSETHLLTFGKCINMFAVLGSLKNMKACLNNDYSFYKRAETFLKQAPRTQRALSEQERLTMFLATHDIITTKLKERLESVTGYEELLSDIVQLCCNLYENKMYVLPKEKHLLLKVIGFALFLLDGNVSSISKLDQRKRINITKIDRIFKLLPVVPLFGDMQISLISYVRNCPHFDSSRWSCTSVNADEKITQYNLPGRMDGMQDEHRKIMCELARARNVYVNNDAQMALSPQDCDSLSDLALRGLRLISSWNTQIMELFYWKLSHLTDKYSNTSCPESAGEYERAVRYNYDSNEKLALVQVIGMIKGLAGMMSKLESIFKEATQYHVHRTLQEFIQITMREPLRKAARNSRRAGIKAVLVAARETVIDSSTGSSPDPALEGAKDPKSGYHIDIPSRAVGPSTTQIYVLRTMLQSLLTSGGPKSFRKDLDGSAISSIEAFLRSSFFYPYYIKFSECLKECSDLSQLWYREFFLELTMGERIQFPIEMSMPWILTDHILQTRDAAMMEYVLIPLDLYNDSADYALNKFNKQYLYDEIEAEVNLCFDQFVFRLSEDIYSLYKQTASTLLLDKTFRKKLEKRYSQEKRAIPPEGIIPFPPSNRFETLLTQRHVQLLGRSVDLNKLLEQRLSNSLRKSIDTAISKFESGTLCSIMELDILLEICKLTHELLSKYVNLPTFTCMLRACNHAVSVAHGRITLHVFWELYYDVIPNYCYNSSTGRFTRTTFSLVSDVTRDPAPRTSHAHMYGNKELHNAYTSVVLLHAGFVGSDHFSCIVRLIGYQGVAVVIEELLNIVRSLLQGTIKQYIKVLMDGMPTKCGLPRYEYGSAGVLEFYNATLENIMQYRDLKTEVFQVFREVGNIIIFCLQIEEQLKEEEILDLFHAAPFQGDIPQPYGRDKVSVEAEMKRLQVQHAAFQVAPVVGRYGSEQQQQSSEACDILTRERLCCGLSVFEVVLRRLQSFLTGDEWKEPTAVNGVMNIEECQEFHRLWSAIQFIYCKPLGKNEISVEETFGEGLVWAGCSFIMLLRQHHRFEALDFCAHILRVQDVDAREEIVAGVDLKRLVRRIKEFQDKNKQIFAVLQKHLNSEKESVRCFPPPIHQTVASHL